MFNPQLDKDLEFEFEGKKYKNEVRIVEKGILENKPNYSGYNWVRSNILDLKKGDTFRTFDPDGEIVTHKDGRHKFVASSNGYIGSLGIPTIEIEDA